MIYDFLSTPIYQLQYSDGLNKFFIKREDLLPFSFGGNKARKAVLFLEDLQDKGFNYIVTYGTSSSNHCRVIANMAIARQLPCHIISPLGAAKPTANSIMTELFNAAVTYCPLAEIRTAIATKLTELKAEGLIPYFIPGGGHGNIGTQAYVNAFKEIIDYENAAGVLFDYIFHASGTGTTQAGLICGNILFGKEKEIVGISISRKNPYGGQVVMDSVKEYLAEIKPSYEYIDDKYMRFIDDYVVNGYGSFNNEILKTIKEILCIDGVSLDAAYTGKAFYGMKEYIKKKNIIGKNILFIHTGGTPLFFDYLNILR